MSSGPLNSSVILLVGDVMRDVIVKPQGALRTGSDTKATIEMTSGGSAANQAVWLAANGVPTRLVARVGDDDLEGLVSQFKQNGVEPIFVGDTDLSTGILVAMISENGERSFYTDRGANEALCPADISDDVLAGAAMVLLSGYSFFVPGPRAVAQDLLARARAHKIDVAIDPSSAGFIKDVGAENFLQWTKGARMLFPNEEEAALLSGEQLPENQLKVLSKYYDQVILTLGAQGAISLDENGGLVHVAAAKVDVLDTTGAGDAFVGGFLSAHWAGLDLGSCLKKGTEQGARAVVRFGGQP